MTREEAIGVLSKYKEESKEDYYVQRAEALNMAIKALEASEDAISRQAVNDLIAELARAISDERCCISRGRSTATIMRDIYHLPSVNLQEPKTGVIC